MFLTQNIWKLREWARQVWPRVAIFCVGAIISAAIAPLISPFVPDRLRQTIDEVAVLALLSILTSSMLGVAAFSLTVMVTAHHFASGQVTPRSHRLLRQDGRTQSVIATFIGAFVFALVTTAAIHADLYGGLDFVVIYGVTILVITAVIVALIRWVHQLASLGSIETTTARVEDVTRDSLSIRMRAPFLGGHPLRSDDRETGEPVVATAYGVVRHVDVQSLSEIAEEEDGWVHLMVAPGDQVVPGDLILRLDRSDGGALSDELTDKLRDRVSVGDMRSFDQDPVFGLQVLSEIGQRALSPGINDPRTAVDVVSRLMGLLGSWAPDDGNDPLPRLRAPDLDRRVMVEAAFDAIARDGEDLLEVQLAVQAALSHLAGHEDGALARAAREISARALARSDTALTLEEDRARVRAAAPAYSAASR
ncbi:DUF2254 domain-containing protein [Jannaschia pohangensis]|uniref:Uncharacterized membrane protein n=1 Tax=Jannaschia pohangensis TaxID=390807 RepID=A0A1I3MHY9_9RHOB|nr:DUF2254 domain-containing protein [Jannaschia pohangensis]SFI96511.1 Uncharacterized membrane protein [Jannaschia pohangensis]